MVSAKSLAGISGRLGTPTWLITRRGGASLGRALLTRSMMFLALRRRGQVGRRHDHDIVGRQQRGLDPGLPAMRQVQDRRREWSGAPHRSPPHRLRARRHSRVPAVAGAVNSDRCSPRLSSRRSSSTSSRRSGALSASHDALAGFVVEVQAHRAEGQVQVDDGGVDVQLLGDAPADIVRQGRRARAAAGADHRHHAADRARRRDPDKGPRSLRSAAAATGAPPDIRRRRGASVRDRAPHRWLRPTTIDLGRGIADFRQAVQFGQGFLRHAAWSPRSADWA